MEIALVLVALLLAFSNGANDNFKGFASVWGSATLSYRNALLLSSLATFAGALVALVMAHGLVASFSGKGLVPPSALSAHGFMFAVACAAALTIFSATRLGLPVSTTHALLGGLVGAGLGIVGTVNWAPLLQVFALPLLLSPLLAAAIGALLYRSLAKLPIEDACVCVRADPSAALPGHGAVHMSSALGDGISLQLGSLTGACADAPRQLALKPSWDWLHIASAMAICFARGLNDTPKLTALLLAAGTVSLHTSIVAVALVMTIGGLLYSRRVAQTMSQKLSRLDTRSGLMANITTAGLVLTASHFSLPVSTTHVAVGSIAGAGASSGGLHPQALRNILLSWCATLPLAAVLAFFIGRLI